MTDKHCPRCGSHAPHLHPAMQHEGEVQPCEHPFHHQITPENTPEKIAEYRGNPRMTTRLIITRQPTKEDLLAWLERHDLAISVKEYPSGFGAVFVRFIHPNVTVTVTGGFPYTYRPSIAEAVGGFVRAKQGATIEPASGAVTVPPITIPPLSGIADFLRRYDVDPGEEV